jgi:hypothetical protein
MRNITNLLLFGIALSPALNGCGPSLSPTATPVAHIISPTAKPPTLTPVVPTATITPIPKGKTIIVTTADDSGPGTLRQAMRDAKPGDTITFDPNIFLPENPTTIFLKNEDQDSALPNLLQGGLTIDASNAGVILDGSAIQGDWVTVWKSTPVETSSKGCKSSTSTVRG